MESIAIRREGRRRLSRVSPRQAPSSRPLQLFPPPPPFTFCFSRFYPRLSTVSKLVDVSATNRCQAHAAGGQNQSPERSSQSSRQTRTNESVSRVLKLQSLIIAYSVRLRLRLSSQSSEINSTNTSKPYPKVTSTASPTNSSRPAPHSNT